MVNRKVASATLALALLTGACSNGASEPPPQQVPAAAITDVISEVEALAKAEAAAQEQGLSLDGLSPEPSNLFGEWQVSFEPTNGESLKGGFLVVLDGETGKFLDLIEYQ